MLIVAIAWIYVVGMAAIAEALSPQGSVLGAVFTFVLYGVLPLSIVLYVLATPARKRARRRSAAAEGGTGVEPDGRGHAPAGRVAPEREEP